MPPWLTVLIPVLTLVLGAALQYLFSRTHESRKHHQTLRTTAYVDFLRGVSATALAQRRGDAGEEAKGNTLMADAKARMCIYGGAAVVGALAEFSRRGANLVSPIGIEAFVSICDAMRREAGEDPLAKDDLAQVLFDAPLQELSGQPRPRTLDKPKT